jgi:hypothetical protein
MKADVDAYRYRIGLGHAPDGVAFHWVMAALMMFHHELLLGH